MFAIKAAKVAPRTKVLDAKSDSLGSIPRIHITKIQSGYKLSSDFYMYDTGTIVCICPPPIHSHKINK